jgi:hypothetical protein
LAWPDGGARHRQYDSIGPVSFDSWCNGNARREVAVETQVNASANSLPSPWQRLPTLLVYPAQSRLLGLILVFSLARLISYGLGSGITVQWLPTPAVSGGVTAVGGALLGLLLEAVLLLFVLKIAVETLLDTARDRHERSNPGQAWASDKHAIGQFVLYLLFLGSTYLLALGLGRDFAWLALLLDLLILPAAVMVHALSEDLRHALNPLAWRELIERLGAGYFGVVALLGLLAALVTGLQLALLALLPGVLAAVCSRFVALYALLLAYHVLGALLHQHHEALAIDIGPPIVRPVLANLMEDQAMQQADTLAARGEPVAAIEVLRSLMHRHGASAPIHDRYRQWLRDLRDFDGLNQHGREYVPALLALGQAKRALALYLESRALDPGFQLDVPEDITRLFAHAVATGQSQLAVELMAGFESRFPRNADVPTNMLACARLMAERLGRAEEARHLLEGLAERFPEHPLAPDIQRALAEVNVILAMNARR